MGALILMQAKLGLETRRKSPVENYMNRDMPAAGLSLQIEAYKKKFPEALHRPVGPCNTYNCHGLTFGSRRTWIAKASEINRILEEDDYKVVGSKDVMPGDIAAYIVHGDVEHSGIVVEKTNKGPRILSKWGQCHEVIHLAWETPYDSSTVTYYRIEE